MATRVNETGPGTLFADRSVGLRPVARSRNTDPDTSLGAAIEVEQTGVADSQRRAVLEALRGWFLIHKADDGPTSAELANDARMDRYAVARRLPELREGCLVHYGPKRLCRIHHRRAVTWRMGPGLAAVKAAEGRSR
jgi:hypothetical protein